MAVIKLHSFGEG